MSRGISVGECPTGGMSGGMSSGGMSHRENVWGNIWWGNVPLRECLVECPAGNCAPGECVVECPAGECSGMASRRSVWGNVRRGNVWWNGGYTAGEMSRAMPSRGNIGECPAGECLEEFPARETSIGMSGGMTGWGNVWGKCTFSYNFAALQEKYVALHMAREVEHAKQV